MEKQTKNTLIIGLILLISGIVLGAFGAHGLKGIVSSEKIISFETGVRYQMLNALGLLTLAALKPQLNFSIKNAVIFILLGIICFSCSIYGLTFLLKGDTLGKVLGPITPIGGLLMIVGWTLVLIKILKIQVKN